MKVDSASSSVMLPSHDYIGNVFYLFYGHKVWKYNGSYWQLIA